MESNNINVINLDNNIKSSGINNSNNSNNSNENNSALTNSIILIDINKVQINKNQPRKIFIDKTIDELAASISNIGIINPIIVIPKGHFYEIISGERRFRAARKLKLKKIPILVKSYDNLEALEVALIDNIQRENLNPIEEALTYKKMQEVFNLNQEQIAIKVGKNRVTIANCVRLLKLDSRVQTFITQSQLSQGHARALLSIPNNDMQYELAEKIISKDLSVREVETITKKIVNTINKNKQQSLNNINNNLDPYNNNTNNEYKNFYINISSELNEILGTKVTIKDNTDKGKSTGKIEIEYYSQNDLDRIVCLFKKI